MDFQIEQTGCNKSFGGVLNRNAKYYQDLK